MIRKYIFPLACLALIASCEKPETDNPSRPVEDPEAVMAVFSAWTGNLPMTMEDGGSVGLFMVGEDYSLSGGAILDGADNIRYDFVSGTENLEAAYGSEAIYFPVDSSMARFVAYYPYASDLSGYVYPVDLTAGEAPDLRYGEAVGSAANEGGNVELSFRRVMSQIELRISAGSGVTEADLENMTVTITGMPVKADFLLSEGMFAGYSDATAEIEVPQGSDGGYLATVLPQAANVYSGRTVYIDVPPFGRFEWTFPMDAEFPEGRAVAYDVTVNYNSVSFSDPEIVAWKGGDVENITVYPPEFYEETPNCYIVAPGSTVHIPVIKAYDMWREAPELQEFDADLSGELTAEVVWQDVDGLVSVSLEKAASPEQSAMIVSTEGSKGSGNAVVAVRIGGVIRWSWHIWVTDYDPAAQSVSHYNGFKTIEFMDRNLGATSNTPDDVSSMGMYYQWGRKDPFPAPNVIYLGTGYFYDIEQYDRPVYGTPIVREQRGDGQNLANAIANPNVFYLALGTFDWYTSSEDGRNPYLWNDEYDRKTQWDPCPEGWRVPKGGAKGTEDFPLNEIEASQWTWKESGFDHPNIGWWPAVGYAANHDEVLVNVGKTGYYWMATPALTWDGSGFSGQSQVIMFDGGAVIEFDYNRALGMSVRCVKDN